MRLRRLDLTRYGKFTDRSFDFGDRVEGLADLHIVYGPNEAGKSTMFSAFLDLLFGIEARSRYNFLHAYPAMRIGAGLEIGSRVHELRRIKRPQNSLLDGADKIVGEPVIQGCLGGMDREGYRAMFSLDDETLEAGGDDILASKGDLGELLFSASAGLADLSHKLVMLRAEADLFHKQHSRSTGLASLKAQIGELKEQRARIDTVAAEFARLLKARDDVQALYDEAIAQRGTIDIRMREAARLSAALPRLAALRDLRRRIAPLAHLPEAPAAWLETIPALQAEETTLSVRLADADRDVDARQAALVEIVIDEAALRLADNIGGWENLRARALTADVDIPDRQTEFLREELAIAGMLARLGQTDHPHPRELILPASTTGALRELLETRSGVQAAFDTARHELSEARVRLQDELDAAGGGLPDRAPDETGLALVAAAVRLGQAEDYGIRARLAENSHAGFAEEAQEVLASLRPWRGDLEAVAALAVPEPERLQVWKAALAESVKKREKQQEELARLGAERVRLEAEQAAITGSAGMISDEQAAAIRGERETAWVAHRSALDLATAELFEAALRRDDLITFTRGRHEADIAKLHRVSVALAILQADETVAQECLDAALAEIAAIHGRISAAIAAMSQELPAALDVAQLESWLSRRDKALQIRANLRQVSRELREAGLDADRARRRLTDAMDEAGMSYDAEAIFEALVRVAQSACDRAAVERTWRGKVEARERELKTRERELEKATKAAKCWQDEWTARCKTGWLRDVSSPAHIATVRETLTILGELDAALSRGALLRTRIDDMQAHQAAFAVEVASAAAALGISAEDAPALELDRKITRLVQEACSARDRKAVASEALHTAVEERRALRVLADINAKRCQEITDFLAADSLAEAAAKLRDISRRGELRGLAAEAERDIVDALRVSSIEDAEALLDEANRAALEAELAELQARFDDLDGRVRELFSEHSKAQDRVAAVGGDEAAARLEGQRRTILLQIEDGAMGYLKRRLGIAAAEHALRAYRQLHRSAMMARASEAFRTMSRGAYSGLASQPKKDGETLVALAAQGGSKIASELSKGTRFQLYLALRVARYHEFAAQRETVPFIADDIMETFDDFRAEEALRLFADMAQVGQVIYMTHHRHLCDMARRICPQVRVHELAA